MKCPLCNGRINTRRTTSEDYTTYRRRQCSSCKAVWFTKEEQIDINVYFDECYRINKEKRDEV